jgi:hypothetical protein
LSILDGSSLRFEPPARPARDHAVTPLTETFLHASLYICILSSFFVFVEPAPYEFLAVLLGVACLTARVTFSRVVIPLLLLLLIRDASGAISLLQVLDSQDSVRFLATSFYLGLSAVLFALLFAQDTMRRIATLRSAYILAAVIASVLGIIGYFDLHFHFFPGLEVFSFEDRAVSAFKDPNVFGPFLIPPLLWLIDGFIVDRIRLRDLLASLVIFLGLLLAFSRAAWGTFLIAAILMAYLLFVTQNGRTRRRVIIFVAVSAVTAVAIVVALLSIDVVRDMFLQRAILLQEYDTGRAGARFVLQQQSLSEILNHPFGMGPWAFMRIYNWVSHNTYLSTMLNHGWIGGAAYMTLVALTLGMGFKMLWVRTPWQTFLIATYLAFFGLALEGFIVDTDHWRHFYLLLGLVWGLAAATVNFSRARLQE